MVSQTSLTDWFLGNKPTLERSQFFPCDVKNNSDIKFSVTLVLKKSEDKILYALVSKEFADFLLSLLSFPLGAVIHLLEGKCCVGSMDLIYNSILKLDDKYMKSMDSKMRLINPRLGCQFKLSNQISEIEEKMSYYCYYQGNTFKESINQGEFYITDVFKISEKKVRKLSLIDYPIPSKGNPQGYVKDHRPFLVTDELVFKPSCPISDFEFLKSLEVPLNDVKNKAVTFGLKEVRKAKPLSPMDCFVFAIIIECIIDYYFLWFCCCSV